MPILRSFPDRSLGRTRVPSRFHNSGGTAPVNRIVFEEGPAAGIGMLGSTAWPGGPVGTLGKTLPQAGQRPSPGFFECGRPIAVDVASANRFVQQGLGL